MSNDINNKETVIIATIGFVAVAVIIWGIIWGVTNIKFPDLLSTHPMPNANIVLETKKCHDGGMGVSPTYSGLTGEIVGIQCDPMKGLK